MIFRVNVNKVNNNNNNKKKITSLSMSKRINSSQKLKMIEISKLNVLNAINATSIKIIVIIATQTKKRNITKKRKKNKNKNFDKKKNDDNASNNYIVVFDIITHAKLNTIILNIITKFINDVSFYACFFKIIIDDVIVITITFFIKKLSKISSVSFSKQK